MHKFLNNILIRTGRSLATACLECPAGKMALTAGSLVCECITVDSCDLTVMIGENGEKNFNNGIENIPFMGR